MDVVSLYEKGIESVVAPLGTALTEQQLFLSWKYCAKPTIMFDGDIAGIRAAYKTALISLEYISPKKLIQFKPYNKKNLIHIFPRLRKGSHWGNKNHASYVDFFKWNDISKLLKSDYSEFKICCHGHIESFDNIQYDIKTTSITDSTNYLFNTQIFISPISGYAEFAYNCGVKYIILLYDKKNLPTIIPIKDNNRIFYININDNLDKLRLLLNNLLQKFDYTNRHCNTNSVDNKIKGKNIIIDI